MKTERDYENIDIDDIGPTAPGPCRCNRKRAVPVLSASLCLSFVAVVVLAALLYKKQHETGCSNQADTVQLSKTVLGAVDLTVQPCEDFYTYACGGWLKNNSIPGDHSSYFRSFSVISDGNTDTLIKILEDNWPIVGQYYRSCMDMTTLNSLGAKPLQPLFDEIDNATDSTKIATLLGRYWKDADMDVFFGMGISPDIKNPTVNILNIGQGGLGMPLPYYSGQLSLVQNYTNLITTLFTLANWSQPEASALASEVVAFEVKISNFTKPPAELRNVSATYNKVDLTKLKALAPAFDWTSFLTQAGAPTTTLDANVDVPSFVTSLSTLINATSIQTLQKYLKWNVMRKFASYLSQPFVDQMFLFFSKTIRGQQDPLPRNKTCSARVDAYMGELLGHYYVLQRFAGNSQVKIELLIDYIKKAFSNNLPNLDWMDDTTRVAAKQKLSLMYDLVGFPQNWTDYTSLNMNSTNLIGNMFQLFQFNYKKAIAKLGKKPDRTEWQMSPPTVNAYYDPSFNTINFPAGILQPPFFDATWPDAMNFGAIGMVIGHELSHGFDDQGAQFDGTGNFTSWWPDAVVKKFNEKTQCYVDQYSKFKFKDYNVDGQLTVGENIADNGGIQTAFRAYKLYVQEHGDTSPIDSSITNDQLFFLSFAQGWCSLIRDQYQIQLIKTDPHAPAFARVNGPLQNFPTFAETFNCPLGTPMNPRSKCSLW